MGCNLAVSNIGSFAEPIGQNLGRNVGRIIGGALGASAIRCTSRSASRPRASSQVRFLPDVQLSVEQHYVGYQVGENPIVASQTAVSQTHDDSLVAKLGTNNPDMMDKMAEKPMSNMANMFGVAQRESLTRE